MNAQPMASSQQRRCLSLIVAMSENNVIGRGGELPWRLSADLQRFKRLTMGHHLIMGRKTFQSIGRALPGRTTVVISRSEDDRPTQVTVVHSLEAALHAAREDDQPFIVGGGQIYRQALPLVDRLCVTLVHSQIEGDVTFPPVDWNQWQLLEQSFHPADARNELAHTYRVYERTVVE